MSDAFNLSYFVNGTSTFNVTINLDSLTEVEEFFEVVITNASVEAPSSLFLDNENSRILLAVNRTQVFIKDINGMFDITCKSIGTLNGPQGPGLP